MSYIYPTPESRLVKTIGLFLIPVKISKKFSMVYFVFQYTLVTGTWKLPVEVRDSQTKRVENKSVLQTEVRTSAAH